MLDWDEDHEVRIFRLAALPPGSLDTCVEALAQAGPPRWPVWVPSRSRLPSEAGRQAADSAIEEVLLRAEPPSLLVAWAGYGERTLAARQVPPREVAGVPDWFSRDPSGDERDWFSVLGLTRNRSAASAGRE
jgi:hypothetical protein